MKRRVKENLREICKRTEKIRNGEYKKNKGMTNRE